MRERYPEDYDQLSREPGFLILRLPSATRSSVLNACTAYRWPPPATLPPQQSSAPW